MLEVFPEVLLEDYYAQQSKVQTPTKRTEAIKWVQGVVKSFRVTLIPLISEHFSQWKTLAMAHILFFIFS